MKTTFFLISLILLSHAYSFEIQLEKGQKYEFYNPFSEEMVVKCRMQQQYKTYTLNVHSVGDVNINGNQAQQDSQHFIMQKMNILLAPHSMVQFSNQKESFKAQCTYLKSHEHLELAEMIAQNLKISQSYKFAPNVPQSVSNPLPWGITAKCTLSASDATDDLSGVIQKGSASINGTPVPAGGLTITIKNGDSLTIQGSGNSETQITNKGANDVVANCNIGSPTNMLNAMTKIIQEALEKLSASETVHLQPNVAQSISNPLFFGVTATCQISTTDASDDITGKMTKGSASLNGQTVPSQGLTLTVKNGDSLKIKASAESEVSITNLGANTVTAVCNLGQDDLMKLLKQFVYDNYIKQLKASETLHFQPNVAQSISNPLFFGVTAKCQISTTDASDNMTGKIVKGTASVNGQSVPSGGITFAVKNGDSLSIKASAESEVSITNEGSNVVTAVCQLG